MAPAAHRPPSPHKWTKRNLDELNATFDSHRVIKDFNPPVFIPHEVQARMTPPPRPPKLLYSIPTSCPVIDKAAKEFEHVNRSKTITPAFEFNVSHTPTLLRFELFYNRLSCLLSLENPQMQPSTERLYTTPPLQTTLPASVMETPPPSSNPVDPQYSSTSNTTSSSYATSASTESKDEHSSESCANDFVNATFGLLRKSLEQIAWYKGTTYRIRERCLSRPIRLILGPSKKWNLS